MLEGSDAGVSFRSVHEPGRGVTWTVLSNTSRGSVAADTPIARRLDRLSPHVSNGDRHAGSPCSDHYECGPALAVGAQATRRACSACVRVTCPSWDDAVSAFSNSRRASPMDRASLGSRALPKTSTTTT